MTTFEQLAEQLSTEASDDYVGIWQVARELHDLSGSDSSSESITSVVEMMLRDPRMTIGQFADGIFVDWTGTTGSKLDRLRRELDALGRDPDIGDVGWLRRQ